MSEANKARIGVATLVFLMVNAVLFGTGLITVLTVPSLSEHAFFYIPLVTVGSFILAPPIAWFVAPSMMQRFLQAQRPPLAAKLSREIESRTST